MRILYAYTEFRNQKGQPSPCRGFEHFEINLGKKYIQCHDACRGQWLRQDDDPELCDRADAVRLPK